MCLTADVNSKSLLCCVNADQRSSPFGLSSYDDISDERSVTGSTVGMSHGFSCPAGPPGVLSASPGGPSSSWKPVAVMHPVSCVASNRAQESTVDVSRLTTNMQVST